MESGPVSTQGLHPLPFILPLPSSLHLIPSIPSLAHAFPHSSDKMAGREEEEEGRVEGAAVARGSGGALGKAHH